MPFSSFLSAFKMRPFISTIVFLTLPFVISHVLVDILKHKHIFQALIFYCNINTYDQVLNHQTINNFGLKIRLQRFISNETETIIPNNFYRLGLVVNTSCEGWGTIFQDLDQTTVFRNPYFWIIFTEDLAATSDTLSLLPIEVDSDVTVLHQNRANLYEIHEVYNTGFYTNGQFIIKSLGYWENSKLTIKETKRSNLSGVVLKCMVVITQNIEKETIEQYVDRSRHSGFDTLHKLKFFTMLKYLRDMYKFSYDLKRTVSWGYQHNGSFDGMIGALQRREIDLGGSPVFFRAERAKVLDYSSETWRSKQCFVFRHPKRLGAFYTIFTRPFSATVWYSALALVAIASLLLYYLLQQGRLRKPGDDPEATFSLAFLSIWNAVCQQGTLVNRSSTSVKLVLFITFLFTLILYQYYNATVVSTLLKEPPKNLRTLEDLLKSDLKTGIEDVLYNYDFFRRTTNPTALKLYTQKVVTQKEHNFFKPEHGMALVKRGGFAFHVDSATGYKIMRKTFGEKEICELQEIELFPPQNMAAVLKQGSPYKEIMAYGHRKIVEAGLAHRIKAVWDEPKPSCVQTPDSSIFSVSIVEFGTPLVVLVLGMVLAFVVLGCEVVINTSRKKKWVLDTAVFEFRH